MSSSTERNNRITTALREALLFKPGAQNRWNDRRARGQTNQQIRAAIFYEWTEQGQLKTSAGLCSWQGLAFWIDYAWSGPPALLEVQLVDRVRRIFDLPKPGSPPQETLFDALGNDTVTETKPSLNASHF